jgi:transketolase
MRNSRDAHLPPPDLSRALPRTDPPLRDMAPDDVDRRAVDAIKMLCADMVQGANSGHPGGPMSLADFVWVVWSRFLRHDPLAPEWSNRDRFVLSGGHTCSILYAMMGLFGYLDPAEWRRFRQLHSLTPGHLERERGAEATTGPLGQGFAMAVGMAIAEKSLRARYGADLVDHRTFVTIGDGDIQEGISLEAAAMAGHLRLGRLVAFFDDNRAQIDGTTDLVTSEDVGGRFLALGWQVLYVDGHDHEQLVSALDAGLANRTRPTLIIGRTVIARGTATREGDYKTHGSPLGEEEIRRTKERMGLPPDGQYHVPDALRERVALVREELDGRAAEWRAAVDAHPQGAELLARFPGQPRPALPAELPRWTPADGKVATRNASGAFLEAVAKTETLIGGAADVGSSIQTWGFRKGAGELQARTPEGRLMHFGVRELGMTAIGNGIAAHGGFVPFCGTFFVFSDYMKPAIRLAALMKLRVVWILTHDSFWLGEDGPTHQPVEHLQALRAVPELTVLRPADANETVEAWRWALQEADGPVALVLSRQNLPVLDRSAAPPASAVARGGYTIHGGEVERPDVLLLASGSEVALCLAAARLLEQRGRRVRVVNLASWELFRAQPAEYQAEILPDDALVRLAVEAGATHGWHRWTGPLGDVHGLDRFGLSAPAEVLAEEFGFTPQAVADHAEALIAAAPAKARALCAAAARHVG